MSYNPDPIFRKGLENYRKSAPASAWERVEAGLDHKRRKGVWLKVAAGLFLLIATLTVFWQYDPSDTSVAAISKKSTPVTLKTDTIVSVVQEAAKPSLRESSVACTERSRSMSREANSNREASVVNREADSNRETSVVRRKKGVSREASVVHELVSAPYETQQISLNEPDEIIAEPASYTQTEKAIEVPGSDASPDTRGISISYSLDMVNERFIKKDPIPEATPAKKNTSGLQKVLDKALDLTNEGTVYGELREKKNEWLSFNVLSNKTEANK